MHEMFDLMKLPEYVPLFRSKKVAILGVGAVGSHLAQLLATMGVGQILCFDFDDLESGNLSKSAGFLRPEDVGRPKALAVAQRTRERMIHGGKCHGIHADLRCFGPLVFAGLDAVFVTLDNYAAKELVNQLLLQIPEDRRPVVGMAGTNGENAAAALLDSREVCLRCLFDESWLENSQVRTSCNGPQYMQLDGKEKIIRTSGLASVTAAAMLAEKFRAWVLKDTEVLNTRASYIAYPKLKLMDSTLMPRQDCPDCHGILAPPGAYGLTGSVLTLNLDQAFDQIAQVLETDKLWLQTHLMQFGGQTYSGFITQEYCHRCGKPVEVYRHESRVHFEDVLCDSCIVAGKHAFYDTKRPVGTVLRAFSSEEADQKLRSMTLFELGYPVGGYLYAVCPGSDGVQHTYCFTCAGDPAVTETAETLERK